MKAKSFILFFLLIICLLFPMQHIAVSQEDKSPPEQGFVETQSAQADGFDLPPMGMDIMLGQAVEERALINRAKDPSSIEGITETALPINAVIYYVDADSACTSSTCAGTSWATANRELFDALSKAVSGDFIVVANGTYKPGYWSCTPTCSVLRNQTNSFVLKAGVQVYGGYAGNGAANPNERNLSKYASILSGNIGDTASNTDNCYHVVTAVSLSPAPLLDGFTIEKGYAGGSETYENDGGGMLVDNCSPTIVNCIFRNNYSVRAGGALKLASGHFANVYQCVFQNNQSAVLGGAIDVENYIGGVDNPYIFQCTFSGNNSAGGGAISLYHTGPDIRNCILWGNTAVNGSQMHVIEADAYIRYTDLQGGVAGIYQYIGNITPTQVTNIDPLFTANLNLSSTSPCIDAGHNSYTGGYTPLDLNGQPRFFDVATVPDTGYGTPPIVDLGAYEAQPPAAPSNLQVAGTCTGALLTWTDNSNNETGFHIKWAASASGPWYPVTTVPANTTTYTDIYNSPTNCYVVMAHNDFGYSASTDIECADLLYPYIHSLVRQYYLSILDREPDAGGWDYWTAEICRIQNLGINVGEGFQAEARLFFNSAEYIAKGKTNSQFVTDLYQTFLQREPDAGGLAYWVGQLSCLTRGMLITQFAYSAEFKTYLTGLFGADTTRPENNMVNDFYRGILRRLPDDDGFNDWLGQMRTAQCTSAQAVEDLSYELSLLFVQSGEYIAKGRSNVGYIEDLYNAILRRGADCGGFTAWVNNLNTMTRVQVLQAFTASPDFQTRVEAVIAAGCLP